MNKNLREDYHAVMEHIVVDDEMRERILKNVADALDEQPSDSGAESGDRNPDPVRRESRSGGNDLQSGENRPHSGGNSFQSGENAPRSGRNDSQSGEKRPRPEGTRPHGDKPHRIRRFAAVIAAAAVLILLIAVVPNMFRMGSASSSSAATEEAPAAAGTAEVPEDAAAEVSEEAAAGTAGASNGAEYSSEDAEITSDGAAGSTAGGNSAGTADGDSGSTAGGDSADPVTAGDTASDIRKKIIYSADISIDTTGYSAAKDSISALITKYDGFIETSNEYNYGSSYSSTGTAENSRTWYVTVRVPAENFDAFVSDTGNVDGVVTSKSISSSDLTKTYSDNENKLKALETEQESLLKLLEKAESVDDMIAIQSRLTDVRAQIESLEDSNSSIDYHVSYSTVNLTLNEVVLYESRSLSFGGRLRSASAKSLDSFMTFLQGFVIVLIYAVPFIILAAVVIFIFRKIKKRSGRKK